MYNTNLNILASDDDIEYAESLLLGDKKHFDVLERRPIIENFSESFDVNACPGSGKTTVLLAKLIVLSGKLPLKGEQGICVLTHTNVAINEIKLRLGSKSEVLFKYPNYFGTIQSFIDKYLAIPFFKRQTNHNIKSIDDDFYYNYVENISKRGYPNLRRTINFIVEKGNYPNEEFGKNLIRFISKKTIKIYRW